jgi:deoxyribonuclease IV
MYGAHLSIAGSLANALREAKRLRMDCVQVFTKNQRQWSTRPLGADEVAEWNEALAQLGWSCDQTSGGRVVAHNSYLINLASPDSALWERSIALQRIELERCEALHIPFCVIHPGAHLGKSRESGTPHDFNAPFTRDEKAGLKRIVKALDRIHRDLPGYDTMTCLETTVGSGSNLGYSFEQLGFLRQSVRQPGRIGFCFDTCHVTAAGYNMCTDERAEAVIQHFDAICGLPHLRVFHLNDSQGSVGSRRDRHAHIGQGQCGRSCFRAIVASPLFARVPKILETPKEMDEKGRPWDIVNIRRLRRLAASERGRAVRRTPVRAGP